MIIKYASKFKKQYNKLPAKMQQRFDERLRLFISDPTSPVLRVHPLMGAFKGYWSLSISGDLRALYRYDGQEVVIFALIGTHSQLYG